MTGLLGTKLRPPSIPPRRVQRQNILQRLDEGLAPNRQVTLVSAPAGFGKTTCVAEWVHTLDSWPVSWLSLDPSDDDPVRFFAYFIAALQEVDASLGQELEGLIRTGQLPPAEILGTILANDILELDRKFLLVLDDFHVLQDRFIYQVLEQLLTGLPEPLHLVLITREDPPLPLASLRGNNRLTEIRARDLRFSIRDAALFLNETMGLDLSHADVGRLEEKTEGWVVGLQLAAIAIAAMKTQQATRSVQDGTSSSSFIVSLSGSHRYILGYLTEQVLSRQPEEIQNFLLDTSVLERLNGDLCNAVTGRSDGRALLERCFNANLFLIPMDEEGGWYRYHHLFADLLRDQQSAIAKEKTSELHRRASRWYAGAGMANEAIQHALLAEDYGVAVELLESHAMKMIMQGYAKTVNAWVKTLPSEWVSQSPRTNLAFAWMHLLRGAYSQASPYLERLEESFSGAQSGEDYRRSLKAEWLVMGSLRENMEGRITESLSLADQALAIVPEADGRVRSLAYFSQACAYQALDHYDRAVDAYQTAIEFGRSAENLVAEMLSTSGLAQLAFEHGQLHLAFEIAEPVSNRIEESGSVPPISTVVFGLLGEVCYQWYRLELARRYYQRALQLSTLGGYNSGMTNCHVLLSRLSQLEGDLETAAREIQKAVDLLQAEIPDYVRQETIAQQASVYLARNNPAAAEMALQGQGFSFREQFSYPEFPDHFSNPYSIGLLYNSSLRVLLYKARIEDGRTGLKTGIELANRLIAGAPGRHSILVALEALLLRAQMYGLLGDHPASQADYIRALELARPERIFGVFIEQGSPLAEALVGLAEQGRIEPAQKEYVERILAAARTIPPPDAGTGAQAAADATAGSQSLKPPGSNILVEPLTERELDVLRLMAEGFKYKEIAARLFISLNTVRFHVKGIYGKLNVNNRTQAIAIARQIEIL